MQQTRVTRLAWVSFAVSVVAVSCVYLMAWSAVYTDDPGGGPWGGQFYGSWLTPLAYYVGVYGTLLAIVLDVIVGIKGKRDRLVAVIGGLVLLLPIGLLFLGWPVPS